jgi:hypothetical protein
MSFVANVSATFYWPIMPTTARPVMLCHSQQPLLPLRVHKGG